MMMIMVMMMMIIIMMIMMIMMMVMAGPAAAVNTSLTELDVSLAWHYLPDPRGAAAELASLLASNSTLQVGFRSPEISPLPKKRRVVVDYRPLTEYKYTHMCTPRELASLLASNSTLKVGHIRVWDYDVSCNQMSCVVTC
jgi:hypothetical protein